MKRLLAYLFIVLGFGLIFNINSKAASMTFHKYFCVNNPGENYYFSRVMNGIDFRAKNLESFDSLEKSSLDLYSSVRSLYLQDRRKKIQNLDEVTDTLSDDDWEEVDSQ